MKKLSLFIIAALLLHAQHSFCVAPNETENVIIIVPKRASNIVGSPYCKIMPVLEDNEPSTSSKEEQSLRKEQALKKAQEMRFAVKSILEKNNISSYISLSKDDLLPPTHRENLKLPATHYIAPQLLIPELHYRFLDFTHRGCDHLKTTNPETIAEELIKEVMIMRASKMASGTPHVPSLASKMASVALKFLGDRPIAATIGALDQK